MRRRRPTQFTATERRNNNSSKQQTIFHGSSDLSNRCLRMMVSAEDRMKRVDKLSSR